MRYQKWLSKAELHQGIKGKTPSELYSGISHAPPKFNLRDPNLKLNLQVAYLHERPVVVGMASDRVPKRRSALFFQPSHNASRLMFEAGKSSTELNISHIMRAAKTAQRAQSADRSRLAILARRPRRSPTGEDGCGLREGV